MLPALTAAGVGTAAGACACARAADAMASITRRDSAPRNCDPSDSLIATSLRAGDSVPARKAALCGGLEQSPHDLAARRLAAIRVGMRCERPLRAITYAELMTALYTM